MNLPHKIRVAIDLFWCKLGLRCPACGWWKWQSPCYSEKHWGEK